MDVTSNAYLLSSNKSGGGDDGTIQSTRHQPPSSSSILRLLDYVWCMSIRAVAFFSQSGPTTRARAHPNRATTLRHRHALLLSLAKSNHFTHRININDS